MQIGDLKNPEVCAKSVTSLISPSSVISPSDVYKTSQFFWKLPFIDTFSVPPPLPNKYTTIFSSLFPRKCICIAAHLLLNYCDCFLHSTLKWKFLAKSHQWIPKGLIEWNLLNIQLTELLFSCIGCCSLLRSQYSAQASCLPPLSLPGELIGHGFHDSYTLEPQFPFRQSSCFYWALEFYIQNGLLHGCPGFHRNLKLNLTPVERPPRHESFSQLLPFS